MEPQSAPLAAQVVGVQTQWPLTHEPVLQLPHSSLPPQPFGGLPHAAFSAAQVVGVHPQVWGTPPPPQDSGGLQSPHESVAPHPSELTPHDAPSCAQEVGVQGFSPQRLGPSPPQYRPAAQFPQARMPPHPSGAVPHSAPSSAQVLAVQVGDVPESPPGESVPESTGGDQGATPCSELHATGAANIARMAHHRLGAILSQEADDQMWEGRFILVPIMRLPRWSHFLLANSGSLLREPATRGPSRSASPGDTVRGLALLLPLEPCASFFRKWAVPYTVFGVWLTNSITSISPLSGHQEPYGGAAGERMGHVCQQARSLPAACALGRSGARRPTERVLRTGSVVGLQVVARCPSICAQVLAGG